MDCFVNGAEIRGLIVIDPGAKKKKKKERFSLNRSPIAKCQKFGGKLKITISMEKNRAVLNHYSSSSWRRPVQQEMHRKNVGHVSYLSCPLSPTIPSSNATMP
jgi:hypothetical protein